MKGTGLDAKKASNSNGYPRNCSAAARCMLCHCSCQGSANERNMIALSTKGSKNLVPCTVNGSIVRVLRVTVSLCSREH